MENSGGQGDLLTIERHMYITGFLPLHRSVTEKHTTQCIKFIRKYQIGRAHETLRLCQVNYRTMDCLAVTTRFMDAVGHVIK